MFDRTAHLYDLLYSFKDYDAESATLVELIRSRHADATSLLDVACGTGRHLELLRASFPDVAGVDIEPGLLEVARTRLPGVPFTNADMRTFDLGRTFDAVTCLFSSIGYLADLDELSTAVRRMAAHLAPGGVSSSTGGSSPRRGGRASTSMPSPRRATRWRRPGSAEPGGRAIARISTCGT